MFGCTFQTPESLADTPDLVDGCVDHLSNTIDAINRIEPDVLMVTGISDVDAAAAELGKVTSPQTRVVVLGQPPGDADVRECYTRQSVPADCVADAGVGASTLEGQLAARLGATFVDVEDWYCYAGKCPAFVGDTPVKMDNRHMTPAYALKIVPAARETLTQDHVLTLPAA
jgi:hypothetical protein